MFIGILGALLFLSGLAVLLITFVQKIMKKPQLLPKKISLSMVAIGIILFFVGVTGLEEKTSNQTAHPKHHPSLKK